MNWLLFAILGNFIYAGVNLVDKFLLRQRATTKPVVYSFYIGILSFFVIVLAPFGLKWPGLGQFFIAFLAGIIYFLILLSFYKSLDINEPSRVLPIVGGFTPVLILLFSSVFLGEVLRNRQFLAFFFLVFGSVLIMFDFDKKKNSFLSSIKGAGFIVLVIVLGSVYNILEKFVFIKQGFLSGFIWSRMGLVFTAFSVLLFPVFRREIILSGKKATAGLSFVLIFSKLAAGAASFFIHLAISKTNVAMVSAMQGVEYVFLLALTVIFSKMHSRIVYEKLTAEIIFLKTAAILLIGAGLWILIL